MCGFITPASIKQSSSHMKSALLVNTKLNLSSSKKINKILHVPNAFSAGWMTWQELLHHFAGQIPPSSQKENFNYMQGRLFSCWGWDLPSWLSFHLLKGFQHLKVLLTVRDSTTRDCLFFRDSQLGGLTQNACSEFSLNCYIWFCLLIPKPCHLFIWRGFMYCLTENAAVVSLGWNKALSFSLWCGL